MQIQTENGQHQEVKVSFLQKLMQYWDYYETSPTRRRMETFLRMSVWI